MTRTLTALYDSYEDAATTIGHLEAAGISPDHISLIANNEGDRHVSSPDVSPHTFGEDVGAGAETGATVGVVVGGGAGMLAGLGMLTIPGLGPVVAAGWLASTVIGAASGAAAGAVFGGVSGGLIGTLVNSGVPEETAHVYAEGMRRGGTLVTVRIDDRFIPAVEAILQERQHVGVDARGQSYRADGWIGFDETAPHYTQTEIEQQRKLYSGTPTSF